MSFRTNIDCVEKFQAIIIQASVIAENLIAVEMHNLEVKFDKSIYVGMCILDISKVCLYEFHHE